MTQETFDWFSENEERPLDALTVGELENACKAIKEQRALVDEMSDALKIQKEKLEKIEAKVLSYLAHFQKDSYKSAYGTAIKSNHLSVRVEDKLAFASWLQDRELLPDFMTFNAMKVKGLALEEIDIAKKENSEFKIPGLSKPEYFEKLSFRK